MKAQIKREFTLILIGSVLVAAFFSAAMKFPMTLMIVSTLLINYGLAVCMWYSERLERPLIFQAMVILYVGIACYCLLSRNETELLGVSFDGEIAAQVSELLVAGVVLVSLVSVGALRQSVKKRIDLWLPPLWPVVLTGTCSYFLDNELGTETMRMFVLFAMGGMVAATAYKNNRIQNQKVAYEITTKHYFVYLTAFSLMILIITQLTPKVDRLPGTELMKSLTNNWGRGSLGDIETKMQLNRNPSQSEEVILCVKSEGPVYLRKIAYSTYKDGEWKCSIKDNKLKPLKEEAFYTEYTLFQLLLDKLARGDIHDQTLKNKYKSFLQLHADTPVAKTAYIEERQDFDCYFTTNGLTGLIVSDNEKLVCYDDMDNLYITAKDKAQDIAYTIEYNRNKPKPSTREAAILPKMNVKDFETLLAEADFSKEEMTQEIATLILQRQNYPEIWRKYMLIPEKIKAPIVTYAEKITKGLSGEMAKAQAICDRLKKDGIYTYKLGAPYTDTSQDPIIDFLFFGREGICQDFASSMVMLCRGCGLPARYVSGYYSVNRSDEAESSYDVRIKDAHAFAEVYISGYGWMLFDPTPSYIEPLAEGTLVQQNEVLQGGLHLNLGGMEGLWIILAVSGLILFCLYPVRWIKEVIWKWYLLRVPSKRSIGMLMKQTIKLLEEKNIYMQQEETVSQLAKRLNEKGINITLITKPFEAYYYGKKAPTAKEMEAALKCYQALKKRRIVAFS